MSSFLSKPKRPNASFVVGESGSIGLLFMNDGTF